MEKRHHGDEKGRRPYPDPSLTPGGRATQRPRPAERGGVTMTSDGPGFGSCPSITVSSQ